MTYIQGRDKKIHKQAVCDNCKQRGHVDSLCPLPKEQTMPLQVTFTMTNPNNSRPSYIGSEIQNLIENLGSSIDHLSVRQGLPLGARQLKQDSGAVHVQSLLDRLHSIRESLCEDDCDTAQIEIESLIKDIEETQ